MKFNYQARDKEGQIKSGVVETSSREAALQILDRHGLYVTILEEEGNESLFSQRLNLFPSVSRRDRMVFSRQLAIMFQAEVSIVEALHSIAEQMENGHFQEQIFEVAEAVEAGTPLSHALGKHRDTFSDFYTSMVKSGEASGTLSDSLEYLAEHEEREYEVNSRIQSALLYPAFVLAVAGAVLFMLMFFVLPNLGQVFEDTGQELPWITWALLEFSYMLRGYWWLILIIMAGGGFALGKYARSPEGGNFFNSLALRLPMFGPFLRTVYLTRFAENISTLIAAGIPVVQALKISGEIVGNSTYKSIIDEAQEGVRRGERITSILRKYPKEFPPIFTRMMYVGERSGALDTTLKRVVGFYRKEVDRSISSFLSILEPVLIVFLGFVVAGIMIAVLMPLYQSVSF